MNNPKPNPTALAQEEHIRDLIDHHNTMSTNKMTVGKYTLKIHHADHVHSDYQGTNKKLVFTKRRSKGCQTLQITLEYDKIERVKCDRGHFHETGRKFTTWEYFDVDWSHVDEIIEWINDGPK